MEQSLARGRTLDTERAILRALCQGTPERAVRADGLRILAGYKFTDTVHQLIFDTLREIPTDDPRVIREQLPTRLNNKGFPDVEFETFFQPHSLAAAQALALMRSLRDTTPEAH